MSRLNPGDLVSGKYRIVRLIGDGGMGVVYEARHEVLGSRVALKFLHAELAKRAGLSDRFLQEARVSATIQSPHVAHVTDVDTTQDGAPYLVMELLTGESLQTLLDRIGKLELEQAVDFGLQILAGLEAAHAMGVVHRDMKPDNVFVTPSSGGPLLKIIDFGIAKLRASKEYTKGLTRAGVVMGTPEYMAPEQLYGAHEVDHRADIYSVGVMLFEMMCGARPADGEDAEAIVLAVTSGRVKRLRDIEPNVPEALAHVLERAMAPDRDARYGSAAELRLALASYAGALSHAGRLASVMQSQYYAPPPVLPGHALSGFPPPPPANAAVPKTLPPMPGEGPPSLSAFGDARTSLSPAGTGTVQAPPLAVPGAYGPNPYGAPPGYGPPPGQYPSSAAPPPVVAAPRRHTARNVALTALALAVIAGGGAVGYGAYRAADTRPRLPLPELAAPPETTVAPLVDAGGTFVTTPNPTVTSAPNDPVRPRPTGTTSPTSTSPSTTPTGVVTLTPTSSSSAPLPTITLPFPLPSNLVIPTALPPGFPSVIPTALPSGFPTTIPSFFPTLPGLKPDGRTPPPAASK